MLNVKNKLKPVNPYMYWYMGGRPPLEPPESGLACPSRQMSSSLCFSGQIVVKLGGWGLFELWSVLGAMSIE